MRNENNRPSIPGYVSIKEAAEILGISPNRVYTYVEEGRLPSAQAAHVIMIPLDALNSFKAQLSGRPRTRVPGVHRGRRGRGGRAAPRRH